MFSDPTIAEWISGLLLMVVSMGILVGNSSLIAWTVIRMLEDEGIQPQGKGKTLDSLSIPESTRTAA